jgi:hypothetical protein
MLDVETPVIESIPGLHEVAESADVTAIHTTNLLGALHVYVKFLRLKSPDKVAPRVVIASGETQLVLEGGYVSGMDSHSGFDEICVRFTTPSVQEAFATLRRAKARIIEDMYLLRPDCATFSIADRDGCVIEFVGRP